MKSGLEDRNNHLKRSPTSSLEKIVSMKSGLEDRNNPRTGVGQRRNPRRLNEVRPGRPEQCSHHSRRLRCRKSGLNEVRPGRPEQCVEHDHGAIQQTVSMKSGLEDRNNAAPGRGQDGDRTSQ